MARTRIRQETQAHRSEAYSDGVAPTEANFETNTVDLEDDLNNLRSAVNTMIGKTNWWDTADRSMETLDTDLDSIETQIVVCNATVLTDVTVTAAQNWELLVVASSEAPTEVAAVAAATEGAIVAQSALSGGGFDVAEATLVVTGPNALSPRNLLIVRDATTKQPLQSGGRDIFGLLQYESTGADGAAFDDVSTGARVKITFVIINGAGTALEICPVVDIATKVVEYNYNFNREFQNVDANCFISSRGFVDQAASVDVTRQNAYTNQGTAVVTTAVSHTLDIGSGLTWEIGDLASVPLFQLIEGSGGGTSQLNINAGVDELDIDAILVNISAGASINSGGTRPINVGVNDGLLESTAGILEVKSAGDLILNDVNMVGEGTWSGPGVKVSDTTGEVTAYEAAFGGEVSLMNALVQANAGANRRRVQAIVTSNVAADNDVSGPADDNNLDVDLGDLSSGTFITDYDFYLNGVLLRNGVNAAANEDIYPGTALADGQVRFEFNIKGTGNADVFTLIDWT